MRMQITCWFALLLGADAASRQFTPNQADWPNVGRGVNFPACGPGCPGQTCTPPAKHDIPDDLRVFLWDGTTEYDPEDRFEFLDNICPSSTGNTFKRQLRGIHDLFTEQTFADNTNPTKAEVDEWHVIVINHARKLTKYKKLIGNRNVEPDHCLFFRSLWADERKFTDDWNRAYPNDTCEWKLNFFPKTRTTCPELRKATDDAKNATSDAQKARAEVALATGAKKCPELYCGKQGRPNPHCGFGFIPTERRHQEAYYLEDSQTTCVNDGPSEGIYSTFHNKAWSVRLSEIICSLLQANYDKGTDFVIPANPGPKYKYFEITDPDSKFDYFAYHAGPFFKRKKFGLSFWFNSDGSGTGTAKGIVPVRGMWGGNDITETPAIAPATKPSPKPTTDDTAPKWPTRRPTPASSAADKCESKSQKKGCRIENEKQGEAGQKGCDWNGSECYGRQEFSTTGLEDTDWSSDYDPDDYSENALSGSVDISSRWVGHALVALVGLCIAR